MSIFSKWFGSKEKEEQREEIAEEKVSFKEDSQDKVLPDPKNLAEALRYIVEKWGVDYLQNRCLLNILNDFQVLKDMPAAKHIILNMQANVSSIFYATYPGKTIGFVHPHNVRGAGRHKFYSNAFETEILELRSRGLTMSEIANKTGCSKSNVSKLIRKHS